MAQSWVLSVWLYSNNTQTHTCIMHSHLKSQLYAQAIWLIRVSQLRATISRPYGITRSFNALDNSQFSVERANAIIGSWSETAPRSRDPRNAQMQSWDHASPKKAITQTLRENCCMQTLRRLLVLKCWWCMRLHTLCVCPYCIDFYKLPCPSICSMSG